VDSDDVPDFVDDEVVEDPLIATGVLDFVGPGGELEADESGLGIKRKAGNALDHGFAAGEALGHPEGLVDVGMELSGEAFSHKG